jgi:predicted glutamine amidotransferase
MCRLLGLTAGPRRTRATFWLLDAPDSLDEQSHRNPDGCGVAGFDPAGRVEMHKAPVAAWEDPDFGNAAQHMESSTFVAHVRHATTGARTYENTHPFAEGDVVFAHNGALGGLDLVEEQLGDYRRVVHGDTDSERMFALILKETAAADGNLTAGIAAAVRWLAGHVPVLSLNLIVVTPTGLWALRYPDANELYLLDRDPGGHHGDQHLHGAGQHGGIRVRSFDLRHHPAIVVASERIDENPAWQLLAVGELVHINHRLEMEHHTVIDHPPRHQLTLPGRAGPGD